MFRAEEVIIRSRLLVINKDAILRLKRYQNDTTYGGKRKTSAPEEHLLSTRENGGDPSSGENRAKFFFPHYFRAGGQPTGPTKSGARMERADKIWRRPQGRPL